MKSVPCSQNCNGSLKVDKSRELLANRCSFGWTHPILSSTYPISGDMSQGKQRTDFCIILLIHPLRVCLARSDMAHMPAHPERPARLGTFDTWAAQQPELDIWVAQTAGPFAAMSAMAEKPLQALFLRWEEKCRYGLLQVFSPTYRYKICMEGNSWTPVLGPRGHRAKLQEQLQEGRLNVRAPSDASS